jgi:hypothetical protein
VGSAPIPLHLDVLIEQGALGRKSGRGFLAYFHAY